MPFWRAFGLIALFPSAIALFSGSAALAGTTWDGGGANNLWSTAANWSPDGVPANNGTSSLAFAGTTRLTPDMDANWSINSLTFNSGAGAFTLGSTGAFTLTIQGGGITNNSASTETINNAITLGAAQIWSATSGALSFGGNIANGGFLLTISGGSNTTASGVISGTGGLTKSGTGTLTLSGAASNTYTGPTTVSQGTLILAKPGSVAAPAITIGGGGSSATVQLNAAYQLYGAATTINSGGQLNLNNNNEFVGALTLSGGSITTGTGFLYLGGTITSNANSVSSTMAGNYILYGSQIFNIASGTTPSGSDLIISGPISEFSAGTTLTKQGAGTLVLSRANTYTGGTTLTLGTLQLSGSGRLGATSGALTVNGGTLDLNGTSQGVGNFTGSGGTILNNSTGTNVTLTIGNNNGTGGNYSGVIADNTSGTGTVALTKTGTGTLTLSGTNSFSGGMTFNAGTVSISSDANLGASSGSLTFGGGALQVTQNVVSSRTISMTGGAGYGILNVSFGKTFENSGVLSGNNALYLLNGFGPGLGFGTVILSGSGSNGTGLTYINGMLSLRGTVSLGSGNLAMESGILELGNGDFTRALGAAAGQVNMSDVDGGAGFAAYGADRVVNLGGGGAGVTWGAGNFVATGQPFYLGTATADHMVDFQNPINLNALTRSINLADGIGTGPDAKISGAISGTGASNLIIGASGFTSTAGSLILSNGNNSYAGTTTINAGTLLLGANATGTAGNTVLGSGASDVLIGNTTGTRNAGLLTNGAFTISRNIRAQSGNTGIMSIGGNTADASTFSGSIFLGTASGAGKGVTLTAANGGTTTFSGVIQDPSGVIGPGLVTKTGAGTVVLSGVNTYAGGTAINAGTLSINQSANLGAIGGGLTINAGTLEVTGTFSTIRVITLGDAASTFQIDPSQTYTVTSAIGGSGALNKTGAGTMVLSGANTYSGGTNVSAGTLQLGAVDRLLNVGAITVSGGTLDLQTFAEIVGSVTLSGGSITGSGAGTLTGSSYTMESGTVSAILNGTGAMTKSTSGTVTLSGANTFTGATTISDGTLTISAASGSALGSTSGITVNTGGTLCLGANDQINNGATMTLAGGTFAKGNFAEGTTGGQGIGALTLTAADSHIDFETGTVGVLSFASLNASTFTLTIDNWTGTYNTVGSASTDRLVFDSDQASNLADFIFTGFGTGGVQFALGGGYFEVVAAVPEPSTYLVGMLALGALGWGSRRRFLAVLRN